MPRQGLLFSDRADAGPVASAGDLIESLTRFTWHGRATTLERYVCPESGRAIPVLTNEYWTSRQRAAHSLHEISYRACFKPQLPAFFIDRLSRPGDGVYDPFAGRGTTLIEAALAGRVPAGCDINPLSAALVLPRLAPPAWADVQSRLQALHLRWHDDVPEDLLAFYHADTLAELCALRAYLLARTAEGQLDDVDAWIQMVTLNRLTGHSPGFLSVYTLPPNQAVSVEAQRKINRSRDQMPPRRDLRRVVGRKSAALLADVDEEVRRRLAASRHAARFRIGSCDEPFWKPASVRLVVTSPPFLDVVQYAADNWLRCWFCGITPDEVPMQLFRKADDWGRFVERAFRQLVRLVRPGGFVAFEVGEVRAGALRLEEVVIPRGAAAGLTPVCVVVNQQTFTKTANIWGVANNRRGTNSNRIVVFERPGR